MQSYVFFVLFIDEINPQCQGDLSFAETSAKTIFIRGVQSHSCDWLKHASENGGTPPTVALVDCLKTITQDRFTVGMASCLPLIVPSRNRIAVNLDNVTKVTASCLALVVPSRRKACESTQKHRRGSMVTNSCRIMSPGRKIKSRVMASCLTLVVSIAVRNVAMLEMMVVSCRTRLVTSRNRVAVGSHSVARRKVS